MIELDITHYNNIKQLNVINLLDLKLALVSEIATNVKNLKSYTSTIKVFHT